MKTDNDHDKFGYLLKEEAEDHLREQEAEVESFVKKVEESSGDTAAYWAKVGCLNQAKRSTALSWGGCIPEDKEVYKVR